MKLNQACSLTSLDFVEQKSYYKYYKFVPETNGKYDFEMSTTPHDENCSVSTNYKVYHNGYEVSNNFKAGEEYIVKIKFDYIKHNTIIAFPSVIFIKAPFTVMPYTITSKNSPKVVSGEIKITDDTQS